MKMQLTLRWAVDTTGDIRDAATGKVVWFKTGMPTDGLPDLVANAPEMYELIMQVADLHNPRFDGAAYMELVTEMDRLADLAQELLAKIEGGGE